METEIWKPVVGYEWRYEVSNLWKIRALKFANWIKTKEMKLYLGFDYYDYVTLHNWMKWNIFYKQLKHRFHRLVAQAFIQNPQNKPAVNHKNWIKTDNRAENLEWVTAWENSRHAYATWLSIKRYWKDNHLSKCILQYSKSNVFIKKWDSIADIKRELWIYSSQISWCCSNKNWYKTAYWYLWRYE